jgi:hypothetical protein
MLRILSDVNHHMTFTLRLPSTWRRCVGRQIIYTSSIIRNGKPTARAGVRHVKSQNGHPDMVLAQIDLSNSACSQVTQSDR